MKIRILDAEQMGVEDRLEKGDVIRVVHVPGGYDQVGGVYGFESEWKDKYFQIVEEEPAMKHSVQNGDHVYTKDLSAEQYEILGDALVEAGFVGEYPKSDHNYDDFSWSIGIRNGENYHGYAGAFKGGRTLSFEEFISNLQVTSEASTNPPEPSTVQRIALAHKACLSACQEAVEAYNAYKQAVEDLKAEAGKDFKIEELTWEEFVDAVSNVESEDDGEWT